MMSRIFRHRFSFRRAKRDESPREKTTLSNSGTDTTYSASAGEKG
jgi:hypothetical protein